MIDWVKTKDKNPPFDLWVLCYHPMFGKYIGCFQQIDKDYSFGNWCDGKDFGTVPPTHWAIITIPTE